MTSRFHGRLFVLAICSNLQRLALGYQEFDFYGESASGFARDVTYLQPKVWSPDITRPPCQLPASSGLNTGVCADDVRSVRDQLSFCKDAVQYRACIPASQPLWPEWNVSTKDALLARLYKAKVEERLTKEMNRSSDVYVSMHLLSNAKCLTALKNALCWFNFPKCDENNQSLPLCRSSCEMYYSTCQYTPNPDTGTFDECSPEKVRVNGLFNSNLSGPDQILGEFNYTCPSAKNQLIVLTESNTIASKFLETSPGQLVIALSILVALVVSFYLVTPKGLRAYLTWTLRQVALTPVKLWRMLPTFPGWVGTVALGFIFVGLVLAGIVRVSSTTTGFGRFKLDAESLKTGAFFVPLEADFPGSMVVPLTMRQKYQLLGSCSCTGSSFRSQPSWLLATVLVALSASASLSSSGRRMSSRERS